MPLRDLTIREIETIPIRVPLRQTYRGSFYQMTHRATILTRIHTREGITGEAFVGDEDHMNDQIERVIRDEIAPRLIGEDAFATERCWELARPATFDILRDRRIGLVACAAVDTATWDAVGKALDQPLWRLWGGYRNRVPVIRTGGYYGTDVPIAAEIAAAREAGVAGMKFKVGGRTPEEDARRFIEARKAAGDDFVLIADANQGYTPDDCGAFCPAGGRLRLVLFRGTVPLAQRSPRHAGRALPVGRPGLRRSERIIGGRMPRSDGRIGHRLLQFRRIVVGRSH